MFFWNVMHLVDCLWNRLPAYESHFLARPIISTTSAPGIHIARLACYFRTVSQEDEEQACADDHEKNYDMQEKLQDCHVKMTSARITSLRQNLNTTIIFQSPKPSQHKMYRTLVLSFHPWQKRTILIISATKGKACSKGAQSA